MVTGNPVTAVTWSVNGTIGGNTAFGTISNDGLYTAPQLLPAPPSVTVTATSQADPTARDSAAVDLKSDIVVNVSPNSASLFTGASQDFIASVSGSGNPSSAVNWSVSGIPGGDSTVGIVTSTGLATAKYTAPAAPPSPPTVRVTATSVADTSRSAFSSVTILCAAANSLSPAAASVALGQPQPFTATLCISPGTPITWDVNGTVGGNSTLGTVTNTGAAMTTYLAPNSLPAANPVTVSATSQTSPPVSASARVTVVSNVSVAVLPAFATVVVNQRTKFSATVSNASNQAVSWAVNGIPNGNSSLGQVCVASSSPCIPPAGPTTGTVDFLAPAAVPSSNPVTLAATSQADPSRSGSSTVTIAPVQDVAVNLSPPYAFLAPAGQPNSTLQFTAHVVGTSNPGVNWSVASAVPGQGCTGSACGAVDSNGLYSSPAAAPSPNAIAVIAMSQADASKSATAIVALTSGPAIETLLPSSVTAGVPASFTLAVEGLNFVAGSVSSGSVILINGNPRTTNCGSSSRCTTILNPPDVAAAGVIPVQVQNPGAPPLSNPAAILVAPFPAAEDVIPLSGASPLAAGKDIVVVEPTTAGATPSQINVDFIGLVTGGNICNAQGSPLTVTRPASGSKVVSICVHGNGLDPSFTYAFSGPGAGDLTVTPSSLGGLFPNLIQLDLTISSATLTGARTLFITTPNNDRAAATGMLEVK